MWYRDTLRTKPEWLRISLAVRKHIGLLSLWFLVMHIIGSVMFFNQAYLKKFFVDPDAYSSKLNWMGEVSFACGVWGTGLYIILGVCSLPSVAQNMTNRQWCFVFGPISWIALCLGFVHTIVQGVQEWSNKAKWYGGYPQMTLTSTVLPMFVIFLKIVQVSVYYIMKACTQKKDHNELPPLPKDLSESESGATPSDDEELPLK